MRSKLVRLVPAHAPAQGRAFQPGTLPGKPGGKWIGNKEYEEHDVACNAEEHMVCQQQLRRAGLEQSSGSTTGKYYIVLLLSSMLDAASAASRQTCNCHLAAEQVAERGVLLASGHDGNLVWVSAASLHGARAYLIRFTFTGLSLQSTQKKEGRKGA